MIEFLEEVRQKQGVQSAPRTLMDRWFEKARHHKDHLVLTIYPHFFSVFFVLTRLPRAKSSRCHGNIVVHFPIGYASNMM